jgi:hypothetical protein
MRDQDKNREFGPAPVQFTLGTEDNFKTFQIFEWLDDSRTQVVCTATDEAYAKFITAALNTCKELSPCRELEE